MRKTERLLAMVLLLQTRGKMTAQLLADILGVSVRTIYRDVDALSLAHVPISMDFGPGGGYFLPDSYRMDPTAFTPREAIALALGAAVAAGSPLLDAEGLQRALIKLEALLPESVREEIRAASERVILDSTAWHRKPDRNEYLEPVRAALWNRRRIEILHRRVDRPASEWRRVEPLGLVCKAGLWYLVAYCLMRRDYRTFRLNRVTELVVLDESVDDHPKFDLKSYWEISRRRFEEASIRLRLVLRVSPHVAYGLSSDHETMRREVDGQVVVAIGMDSSDHALRHVLSLGPEAEVLEPAEVRRAVAQASREMAAIYGVRRAAPMGNGRREPVGAV